MITFEKETDVHWKILRYGLPVGSLGIHKRSLRVYIGDVDVIVPNSCKSSAERLKMVLEMIYQQKDGVQKQLEKMEVDNSIKFKSKEL